MMRFVILTLFVLFQLVAAAQDSLVATQDQNVNWYQQVSKVSIPLKMKAISQRILSDTSLVRQSPYICRLVVTDSDRQVEYVSTKPVTAEKPFIVLNGFRINTDDTVAVQSIMKISNLLQTLSFQKVELLAPNEPKTAALYGSVGAGGVIFLTLQHKPDIKYFAGLLQ